MTGGNRISILLAGAAATVPAAAAETIAYRYDARGRLVEVARTGNVNNGAVTAYAFDKADNRIAATVTGASGSGSAPPGVIIVPSNGGYRIIPTA